MPAPAAAPAHPPDDRTFRRLIGLLRPWWGWIAVSTAFVVIAAPSELFPAVVWGYVTDVVVLNHPSKFAALTPWFSFGGRLRTPPQLLLSSVSWLFVVYLFGQVLESLEGYILNRVAERFILGFRNDVYGKAAGAESGLPATAADGRPDGPGHGRCGRDRVSFIVNSIDTLFSEGILWAGTVAYVFLHQLEGGRPCRSRRCWSCTCCCGCSTGKVKPIYAAARAHAGGREQPACRRT